jgi:hypothetical protein
VWRNRRVATKNCRLQRSHAGNDCRGRKPKQFKLPQISVLTRCEQNKATKNPSKSDGGGNRGRIVVIP